MVAGGVQSVEEGALYATHPSYYPQFYSTLLPPAPPGSYSSSNYSSSTYSSSGQSSDYSWLKLEGGPGGCRPSPTGRTRHPRCTCPSPEALRQARRALAARRARVARDPRCTCPSPTLSRDPSPWGGGSPSPPSTPATASPPPRHPRCTCPEPDLTHRLSAARRARSARDLRCTCPTTGTPTPTPTPPPHSQEPTCTCQPPLSTQPQQPLTRRASKSRLVHAVLLNSPGNTAISTEHGDFVPLSDAPTKISESPNLSKTRAKAKKQKEKSKGKGAKSDEDTKSGDGGEDSSQPASPARRVKDKLCHLRHKMVSGVAALTSSRPHSREGDGHTCRCESSGEGGLRVRAPGTVTRVLPAPAPTPVDLTPQGDGGFPTVSDQRPAEGSFPVEDLPQPILEGVCSPLGEVPPLSPPEEAVTPFPRQPSSLSQSMYSHTPLASSYLTLEGHRSPGFIARGLRDLQRLSASHGHLYSPESAALSRTKSLELCDKDSQEGETESSAPSSRGSVIHLPPASSPAQCWTKQVLPQSSGCRLQTGGDTVYISTPCISTNTSVSTALGSSRISAARSVDKVPEAGTGPDYENVVFHDSGRYVMLSKRLLDKWQLSYEACLPPEHTATQPQRALHGEGGIPTVTVTENVQVSTALPCDERESDNVALTLTPPSATSTSTTSTTATHRTSHPSLLSTFTHSTNTITSLSSTPSYSSLNQSFLDMTLQFPEVPAPPRLSLYQSSVLPSPPTTVTSLINLCSSTSTFAPSTPLQAHPSPSSPLLSPASTLHHLATQHVGGLVEETHHSLPRDAKLAVPKTDTPRRGREEYRSFRSLAPAAPAHVRRHSDVTSTYFSRKDDGDTDQETDRLLGQQRSDDPGFYDEKGWRRPKTRTAMPRPPNHKANGGGATNNGSTPSTPIGQGQQVPSNQTPSPPPDMAAPNKTKNKKEKETNKKKGRSKEVMIHEPAVLIEGVLFRARYLGSTQLVSEGQPTKTTRMMQAEEAVSRIKALAPDGESQPSTEVDLFISTEKIMVLNTDLKEIMMDHALRTISYIADIGDLVVLMARRRVLPTDDATNGIQKTPKMICHVFESDEAQFIAQSIGQAFQVAYLEFLKANGIEDHSFVKEMDYQEVLNSQEIFGDELQMFAKKELQKEELYISKTVVVPKMKSEILGVVVVESGWGSMVPTVVIANLSPTGAAAKCGQLNIGDQIIAINGVSLVGLPLSTCQNYIKNTKYNTAVKLTVVPCPPVVEVKIRRPDTKYQLGFSVQNGVICSLLRGGIAERGGVRVGHRIIDINSQSVVAVPHEKIVNLLATSVGEIRMKTMPTSIFRLLTGQETPQYI